MGGVGGREASSLLSVSGFQAGPAGEVLVHFPMETILLGVKGEEPCLSNRQLGGLPTLHLCC